MKFGDKFEHGLRLMLDSIAEAQSGTIAAPLDAAAMRAELAELATLRGRPAFYSYLGSGLGRGARAMLSDGRWVLDFALGVGVHFFGHGNLDLIETAIRAAALDLVMQGNLIFNREYHALMKPCLRMRHAEWIDAGSRCRALMPTRTRSNSCVKGATAGPV